MYTIDTLLSNQWIPEVIPFISMTLHPTQSQTKLKWFECLFVMFVLFYFVLFCFVGVVLFVLFFFLFVCLLPFLFCFYNFNKIHDAIFPWPNLRRDSPLGLAVVGR